MTEGDLLRELVKQVVREVVSELQAGAAPTATIVAATPTTASSSPADTTVRIERGAVTERAVVAAAKAGRRIVLGPRAVVTPLARDKARTLGVALEKEA